MYVDLETFRDDLPRLVEEHRARNVRILVAGYGVLQFEFQAEDESRELEAVAADVADCLNAVVRDVGSEGFAEMRGRPRPISDGATEDPTVAREKYELVRASFPVAALERRVWIKLTSKTDVPLGLEWDVLAKYADEAIPTPGEAPVPYGMVKLMTYAAGPAGSSQNQVILTVDSDDVDYMIETLGRLRDALHALEKGTEVA